MPSDILNALSDLYASPAYNQSASVKLRSDQDALRRQQMLTDQLAQQQADQAGLRFQLGTSQAPLGGVPTEGVPAGGGLSATMPPAPPDPDKVALDYYATRDPAMHASIMQNIGKMAQEVDARSGPQEATTFFNKKTGMNLQVDKAGKIVSVNDKGVLISGIQNPQTGEIHEVGRLGKHEPILVKEGEKLVDPDTYKTILEGQPKETDKAKDEKLAFDAYAAKYPELKKTGDQLDPNQRVAAIGEYKRRTGSTTEEERAAQDRIRSLTEQKLSLDLAEGRKAVSAKGLGDLADDVAAGRIAPQQMTQLFGRAIGKGGINRAEFMRIMHERHPGFNFAEAGINYQAGQTVGKQVRSVDAADGALAVLAKKSQAFGRSDVTILNDGMLSFAKGINSEKAIEYQTAYSAAVNETAAALSGGGVPTDDARKEARGLFATGYGQGGMNAALRTVHESLAARRAAFAKGTTYEKKELLPSGGTTRMQAPDGRVFNVPNDKVEAAKQNGGVIIQ